MIDNVVSVFRKNKIIRSVAEIVLMYASLAGLTFLSALIWTDIDYDVMFSAWRLIIGTALFIRFRKDIRPSVSVHGVMMTMPCLLFALYNVLVGVKGGGDIIENSMIPVLILEALSAALFEEVLFRGVFLGALLQSRKIGDDVVLSAVISAFAFSVAHLLNFNGEVSEMAIQMLFSLALGLNLSLAFITTGELVPLIAVHFAINASAYIFTGSTRFTADTKSLFMYFVISSVVCTMAYGLLVKRESRTNGFADSEK